MRKRTVHRSGLSFRLSLEQPQTLMVLPLGSCQSRASQAVSIPPHSVPGFLGAPLPLCCGTALCRVPSSSPPGGAQTRPAATSH